MIFTVNMRRIHQYDIASEADEMFQNVIERPVAPYTDDFYVTHVAVYNVPVLIIVSVTAAE